MLLNYTFAVILGLTVTISHASLSSRIVGGYRTNIEKFPFTVFVTTGNSRCAGTIITPSVIVTAAHCIKNGIKYFIIAGTDELNEGGVRMEVINSIIHPQYDRITLIFDIALLKLKNPLTYSPRIQSIKLPKYSRNIEISNGTALGWGRTYNSQENMNNLRAVDLYVQRKCEYLGGMRVYENMFCAGHPVERKDICDGDSGGPFVNNGILYGIVSFGTEVCAVGDPAVFVKVSYLVNWIKENLHNF